MISSRKIVPSHTDVNMFVSTAGLLGCGKSFELIICESFISAFKFLRETSKGKSAEHVDETLFINCC